MTEITHPTIKDGWFREINDMWPGQAMTLAVKRVVHHEKSAYQDVLIFESTSHGMVLVLDNVIQCTERDEFAYQEMIAHLALFAHPDPQRVLVIGGGDGGVLREVVKHPSVRTATLCDIDEAVIRLSKQYLPAMSAGFDHPNVTVHVGDGFKFLEDKKGEFDVIITDSSDPDGPAESLFQKPYFELLHGALREGGVITTQGERPDSSSDALLPHVIAPSHASAVFMPLAPQWPLQTELTDRTAENPWLHLDLITNLKKQVKEVFPVAQYAWTTVPTYPSGQIGFLVCSKDASLDVTRPTRKLSAADEDRLFNYYSAAVHEAAFVLPKFAEKALR